MSMIHGLSHKALAHFRDEPAALAVFWTYCARADNEGIAYPSLRGLAATTGWNTTTVSNARKWLVDHGALELVTDYTRKAWRALPEAELRKKRGLDKSEYYRVTGVLVVGGKRFDILYFGGHTAAPELDADDSADVDVLPDRTSTPSNVDAVDHLPGGTELSTSTQLSTSSELSTTSKDDDDEDARARAKVFQSYHENIGPLTGIISDDLKAHIQDYGTQWVIDAIAASARNGARSIAYVSKVLQNWQQHGRQSDRPATPKGTGPVPRPSKPNTRVSPLPPLAENVPPPSWLNSAKAGAS